MTPGSETDSLVHLATTSVFSYFLLHEMWQGFVNESHEQKKS